MRARVALVAGVTTAFAIVATDAVPAPDAKRAGGSPAPQSRARLAPAADPDLEPGPRGGINYVATPPALADVDGDGLDEAFIEEEDWALHAYRANGTVLPAGPPVAAWAGRSGTRRRSPISTGTATWRS
jgi:hypothetical protein